MSADHTAYSSSAKSSFMWVEGEIWVDVFNHPKKKEQISMRELGLISHSISLSSYSGAVHY